MHKNLVVLVGLTCIASVGVASADGPTLTRSVPPVVAPTADTLDIQPIQKRLALRRAAQEKYLAVAKADPRFEQVKADLAATWKITDLAQRKTAMKATAVKWQAYRNEMLKKANLDASALKAQTVAIPMYKSLPVTSGWVVPPNQPTTMTASSFPEQFTYKKNCPDGADKWAFSPQQTFVNAGSAWDDSDCDKVSAGKGARFELPAGVKKVEVTAEWAYHLEASVVTLGAGGIGYASTGLRAESLAGVTLSTSDMPSGPVPWPVRSDAHVSISAECAALPYCDDGTDGTARMTMQLNIDKPGGLIITPYVNAGADADLTAGANGNGAIVAIKSISLKVYK